MRSIKTFRVLRKFYSLIDKLIYAFNALKAVNFDGVYQGDLLFWPGLIQKYVIGDKEYLGFRPNTILYTFPIGSKEAKQIQNYDIGIAFHTKYDPSIDEEGKQRFVNKKNTCKIISNLVDIIY